MGDETRAVVFDLDGTLVESRFDLAEAVNRTRAAFDLPPLAVEAILSMVGEGARNLVRRGLGGRPSEELVDRALERFLDEYEPICTQTTRPFPGVVEAVSQLGTRYRLAILTNKPERMSRKIVEACGWSATFEELIGGDSLPVRKPDPGGLIELARRLDCEVAELALVGDSAIDAATARAAGSRFVWVSWGFARAQDRALLAGGVRVSVAEELPAVLAS